MTTRTLIASATLLLLASVASSAGATPADYLPLMKAEKFADVEKLANTRLAQDPRNIDAMIAKGEALLAMGTERLEDAIKLGDQCASAYPMRAECQEIIGSALGAKASTEGIMAAMGYASKIKDAMKKAVELDPKSISARYNLMMFYSMAPGIAGGSSSKAKALAIETAQFNPEASKLLLAQLDFSDKEYAKAEATLLSMNPSGNEFLIKQQRNLLSSIGFRYLDDKKFADCERVFNEMQKRFADHDIGIYGQARLLQAQGKHVAAIALLDKANSVAVVPRARNYFRLGQSLQATNEKAKAIGAYEKALSIKPALSKPQLEDISAQLKVLKA